MINSLRLINHVFLKMLSDVKGKNTKLYIKLSTCALVHLFTKRNIKFKENIVHLFIVFTELED